MLDEVRLLRAFAAHVRRGLASEPARRRTELLRAWQLYRLQMWPRPTGRYSSLGPGRQDWQDRWDAAPGRRILFYAFRDFAGSFYRWAEAINRHTPYAARLVTFGSHEYGYDDDLVMPRPKSGVQPEGLAQLVGEADLIHIKDESGFVLETNRLPSEIFTASGKPRVFTAYGGYMRALSSREEFRQHVHSHDAVVAMTPDLIYDWLRSPRFIPHAIDTERFDCVWQDRPLVAHSPSTQARKGTADFLAAMQMLQPLGIEMDLIHSVSHDECMDRKRHAGLFFDQAGSEAGGALQTNRIIGWYGNSALEAAVFGIPTLAHLAEFALDGSERAGRSMRGYCAIMNTAQGPEGLRASIGAYFERSVDERQTLSLKTRRFVEQFHSYAACSAELAALYDSLLGSVSARNPKNKSRMSIVYDETVIGPQ